MHPLILRTFSSVRYRSQFRYLKPPVQSRSFSCQFRDVRWKPTQSIRAQTGTPRGPSLKSLNTQIGKLKCQASGVNNHNNHTKRSFLGWILRHLMVWFGFAAAVISLFIASLPSLLSTSFGLGAATMGVNIIMPGIVEVKSLSAGWNRPVHIEGILIKDGIKKAIPVLKIDRLSTSRTLWEIVSGKNFELFVLGPVVNAFPDEAGNIPAVRYAQKAGLLLREEKRVLVNNQQVSEQGSKKRTVVRTKHFEEWISSTAKKARREPRSDGRSFVQSPIRTTAELRSKGRSILVNDGMVLVTKEVKSLIGDFMHLIVAEGFEDVKTISEDLGLKSGWISTTPTRQKLNEGTFTGDPILFNLDSPHVTSEMRGWTINRSLEMQRPGRASITVTPAFSRECLAKLNPLLNNMVAMKSGSKVQVDITTKDRVLPSPVVNLHLQPIQLTAGSTPFWDSLLNLLRVKERGLVPGQPLQVWTSAIDCSIVDNEVARCKRCDMLLGPPNKGVHVVVWGECALESGDIKMWLGIPADTLQRIGYKNLKADYVLPIPLRGSVENPRVDWNGASDEISKLAFSQLMGDIPEEEAEGFEGYWKTKLLSAAKKTTQNEKSGSECVVPTAIYPLPWEESSSQSSNK
eukprot:g289.t1